MTEVHSVWPLEMQLGEGPVWVAREETLYFVDIDGRTIHSYREDGLRRTWKAPVKPGFIVPAHGGRFICGMRGGLYDFDPLTGAFRLLHPIERNRPRHRLNDGFVDGEGRLWFGSMHEDCKTEGGSLYSWQDRRLQNHDGGYIVTNGPTVSPDRQTLYHTDSIRRTVYAFDLGSRGTLSSRREFLQFEEGVNPDGMATDHLGNLWIALFNGWRLELYSPKGEKLDEIRFPRAQITKPAFGGCDLRTLYVTTARKGLTPEDCVAQPLAGALFAVRVQTPGLRAHEAVEPALESA